MSTLQISDRLYDFIFSYLFTSHLLRYLFAKGIIFNRREENSRCHTLTPQNRIWKPFQFNLKVLSWEYKYQEAKQMTKIITKVI